MIPYGRQDITKDDIEAVVKVLCSDFITQGSTVPAFEQKLCEYTKAKYAIAVNSATSALHVACLALGLSEGDILWTSPITFVASANCALYCGASVDFVDVDPNTGLMNVKKLEEKLVNAEQHGKLPKIVIPVHFAGQSCDMEEICKLSQKYGFKIIEDAAHAIGAKYKKSIIGDSRYSDITIFSFHPVKIITTGEGGAAMTNNSLLAEKMRLLRSHGITRDPNKMSNGIGMPCYYEQVDLGFNYRMSDIHAAIGISQIDRLDKYVSKRNKISCWYDDNFKNTQFYPLITKPDRISSKHLYVVQVPTRYIDRNKFVNYMISNGIGVNIHYRPIYQHKIFNINKTLKGAEEYYSGAVSPPIYPSIKIKDLEKIVDVMLNYNNQ